MLDRPAKNGNGHYLRFSCKRLKNGIMMGLCILNLTQEVTIDTIQLIHIIKSILN